MIHDFYDDPTGAVLIDIFNEVGPENVPDYVKTAALHPSETIREEKSLFAWPARNKFACDTMADTWMSARYFAKTAHLVPFQYRADIENGIKSAAALFGIEADVPMKKEAAVQLTDGDFLVVEVVPTAAEVVKQASLDNVEDLNDGTVTLRLYPVNDAEAVRKSAAWFPRGLTGELSGHRKKVASRLAELCAEHGVELTQDLIDETRPIKRSHLLDHIQQRIGIILDHNQLSERNEGIRKAASERGMDLPYAMSVYTPIDARLVTGYQELQKMAYLDPIPAKFWDLFGKLDKAAGMEFRSDVLPVTSLNREVDDDMIVSTCKLAGQIIYLPQLMEKVSTEMWQDLAPEVLDCRYDFNKVAKLIPELDEMTQQILMAQVRGY